MTSGRTPSIISCLVLRSHPLAVRGPRGTSRRCHAIQPRRVLVVAAYMNEFVIVIVGPGAMPFMRLKEHIYSPYVARALQAS